MTNAAILAVSALLVFAYLLDIFGRRTRLPSVVLLVATGMIGRQVMDRLGLPLGWVDPVLPAIGTFGLILIVLEGALDLSLTRERLSLIGRASFAALAGFLVCVGVLTWMFQYAFGLSAAVASLAAMPFAVISSAVAIPNSVGLPPAAREFIVYESSLSDIVGILVFYSWLQANGSIGAFATGLAGGGLVSLIVSAVAAVGLVYLINRVVGHVRFLPLLAGITLIYAVGKQLHLSPLIVVLVCGLLLNNTHLLQRMGRLGSIVKDGYADTLAEFKGLVAELTFATKSFFFLMLGYWTDVNHMTDWRAWAVMVAAVGAIYPARTAILWLLRQRHARRIVWVAPRGLITVLLFLTAAETGQLQDFPFGAVMLLVLVTATATTLAHRDGKAPNAAATQSQAP
ncbi:MAG TPA: cation:proton antiporter [Steroidobacteraceae bacterium]